MFYNYFKIAIRNLAKHKLFSFINIFGLALSICIGLIVILRLQDELSYDRFHPAPDRTHRIYTNATNQAGQNYQVASTPLPLATALNDRFDFIEQTNRIYPVGSRKAAGGIKQLNVKLTFTDPSFFEIFGFRLAEGNEAHSLSQPNKVIISSETAARFFNNKNAVGEILTIENMGTFQVTGVLEKSTHRSHIDFDVYASMSSIPILEKEAKLDANLSNWGNLSSGYTYVLLKKKQDLSALKTALHDLVKDYSKVDVNDRSQLVFETQSITRITPGPDLANGIGSGPSIGKVATEVLVALIILISACFNYTNLSLARAIKRAKEVGVRKISGASHGQVFLQFVVESVLVSLLSLCLAYLLMELLKPVLTEFLPPKIHLNPAVVGAFILYSVFAGLIAGFIPALTLSRFKPASVLKNLATVRLFGRGGLRKALVVFQFSLSTAIIIFMLVFYQQFQYMAKGDYGFKKEGIINVPFDGPGYRLLKNELASISGIEKISATSENLGRNASGSLWVKDNAAAEPVQMQFFDVDEDFADNMSLKFLAGNSLQTVDTGAEKTIVINEQAVAALKFGTAHNSIGKTVLLDDSTIVQVAGVVKDFHYQGFEVGIAPMIFRGREKAFRYFNVKTRLSEEKAAPLIAAVKSAWKKVYPDQLFSHAWFSTQFYESKAASGTVSMLAFLAFMTITIACLGLLGMVVYTVEGRIKEISIRKVMGAGVGAIVSLLSKGFLKLVMMAILIAGPVGFICSYIFLQMFAMRISIGFWLVLISGGTVLLLALIVIGSQVIRIARANPAVTLRAE